MIQYLRGIWNKLASSIKKEKPPLKSLKDINFETDEDIWHWDLVEKLDGSKEETPEKGLVTVTTTERGECVMVSRQDEEHQILEVIWQKDPEMIAASSLDLPLAFNIIKRAMETDIDYAWGWHCNIAMASVDEGLSHEAANKAAARFMYTCFGVKTYESKQYKDLFAAKQG